MVDARLMQDQIHLVGRVRRTSFRFVPCEHERSHSSASMTKPAVLALLPDIVSEIAFFAGDIGQLVNEDSDQLRVVICFAMQKKETRLRGDRDSDLIIESETAAAFEVFLMEEHLNARETFPDPRLEVAEKLGRCAR